jgi:hypothetical protein
MQRFNGVDDDLLADLGSYYCRYNGWSVFGDRDWNER